MLRAILIDDEKNALIALRKMIEQFCPQVQVVGESHTAIEGIALINRLSPDVVFLDVEMPGGTGFDLLAALEKKTFITIFTTAHVQYTIPAIRAGAVDYLLKPVNIDELRAAVKRVAALKEGPASPLVKNERVTISNSSGTWFVSVDEIICIGGDGRSSCFYLRDGSEHSISTNLGELEGTFSALNFFRVHKSWLVNCGHVKHISTSDGGFAVLSNGKEIEISRRKKAEFIRIMERQRGI
jgi:two-component system LytT family response regulator